MLSANELAEMFACVLLTTLKIRYIAGVLAVVLLICLASTIHCPMKKRRPETM